MLKVIQNKTVEYSKKHNISNNYQSGFTPQFLKDLNDKILKSFDGIIARTIPMDL